MLNKIECKEGYVFALKDKSEVYDNVIYLGKYDSADNYIQITKKEAIQITCITPVLAITYVF